MCFLHHFNEVFVEPNSSWVSVSTLTAPEGWTAADLSHAAWILFSSQWANVQLQRWNFGSAVGVTWELKPWKSLSSTFSYYLQATAGCSSLLVKAKEQIQVIQKTSSHADNEEFYSATKVILLCLNISVRLSGLGKKKTNKTLEKTTISALHFYAF